MIKFFIMWISRGPTCDCCFLAYHLPLQRKVWQGCLCRYLSSMSRLLLDYNLTSFWLNRKAQLFTVNPCPLDIHRVPQHLHHLVIWLTFFSLLMVLFVVRNPKLDAVLQMHSLQCLKKIMSVHHPGGYSCYCSICTLGLHFSKATLLTRVQLVLLPFLQSYFLPSLYCYIAVLNCRCRTFHLPLDFVWFLLGQGPFGEQHCLEEKWSLVLFSTQHHEGSTGQALISVMTAIRPKRIVWSQGNGRWVLGGGSSPEGDCTLSQAPQGSGYSTKLLEFKEWLDSTLRHRVWISGDSVWSLALDSMIFLGAFQLGIFHDSCPPSHTAIMHKPADKCFIPHCPGA